MHRDVEQPLDAGRDVVAQPLRRPDRQRREDQGVERAAAQHVADRRDGARVTHFTDDIGAEGPEPFECAVETPPGYGDGVSRRPLHGPASLQALILSVSSGCFSVWLATTR